MDERFKVSFSFVSLVSIGALIGFCAGVVSVPLYLLNLLSSELPSQGLLWMAVLAPVGGLLNGALLGLLAYPFYWWLSKRIGFSYRGQLFILDQEND